MVISRLVLRFPGARLVAVACLSCLKVYFTDFVRLFVL